MSPARGRRAPAACTKTPRPCSCSLPSPVSRNAKQAFRASHHHHYHRRHPDPSFSPGLVPSTTVWAGLPLPWGHRRRRQRGRKNTGKLLSYLQRARAYTDTSSLWASLPVGAAPARRWPESPFCFEAGARSLNTFHSASPPPATRRVSLGHPPPQKNNLTAPPSPMYKSVLRRNSETQLNTNPGHSGIRRLPGGFPMHTGVQLHIFLKEARETQPVLPRSSPPSSEPVSRLAPSVRRDG